MSSNRKRKFILRKSSQEAFRLHTQDISEESSLFSSPSKRGALIHFLRAGGLQETRDDIEDFSIRRSWRRYTYVLIVLVLTWLLGFFWP